MKTSDGSESVELTSFPSKQFYGSRKRLLSKRSILSKHSEDSCFKGEKQAKYPTEFIPRLLGATVCWKIFYRQSDAFEFARQVAEDVHVFAFENCADPSKPGTGQRQYIASSLPVFWHYYRQLPASKKVHYEVIPEGSACKLYFDLEYQKEFNQSKDGDRMVNTLIKYVCEWLTFMFKVDCDRKTVLELDASTHTKFSRHLIFQDHSLVFDNNISMGNFLKYIFGVLQAHLSSDPNENSGSHAWVSQNEHSDVPTSENASPGRSHSPCKKNTEESEIGKGKELETSILSHPSSAEEDDELLLGLLEEVEPTMKGETGKSEQEVEMAKTVFDKFPHHDLHDLVVMKADGTQTLFCDLGVYTKNRNFRLYQSSKLNKNNPLVVAPSNEFKPASISDCQEERALFFASLVAQISSDPSKKKLHFDSVHRMGTSLKESSPGDRQRQQDSATLEGLACSSPYPEVDQFIVSLVSGQGRGGWIRRWNYWGSCQSLVYDIAGYRWCHRVQRQHRSNNIMYVVDVGNAVYYQKCHDPECVGYKSPAMPLPREALPGFFLEADDFLEPETVKDSVSVGESFSCSKSEEEEEVLLDALEDVEMLQATDEFG